MNFDTDNIFTNNKNDDCYTGYTGDELRISCKNDNGILVWEFNTKDAKCCLMVNYGKDMSVVREMVRLIERVRMARQAYGDEAVRLVLSSAPALLSDILRSKFPVDEQGTRQIAMPVMQEVPLVSSFTKQEDNNVSQSVATQIENLCENICAKALVEEDSQKKSSLEVNTRDNIGLSQRDIDQINQQLLE